LIRAIATDIARSGVHSCPWVGLTHGLGRVGLGRDLSVFGGLEWVGFSMEKVLKLRKDYVNAFKARSVKNMNKLMLGGLKVRD